MNRVIIDSGPLAAYFCENDQWFDWVRETLRSFPAPLFTCEAVITEAAFLIGRYGGRPEVLLSLITAGPLKIGFDIAREAGELEVLLKRYRSVPVSLADACLIRMSETMPNCSLLTTDSDFRIYRRFGRQVIPLIAPWG